MTLPERKHLPETGSDLQSEAHEVFPDVEHEEELPLETDMPQIADSSSEEKTLTVEIWDRAMKKMEPPLASKLSKADFKLSGDKLILTLHGGYSVFSDSIKKNSEIIERILTEELGTKIRLEVETAKKKTVRKKDLKAEVMADPAIKEVLELFDGRIVDVTPVKE